MHKGKSNLWQNPFLQINILLGDYQKKSFPKTKEFGFGEGQVSKS
ncbi:hypothetical protein P872_22560 [Rhodonellum psychrophilum GCM71 = DSM 17998]|uniref:Uncharacterized protein n=1 Tax=Rhodonellum psychrophilum GCM71 = DSM 17998 TaxID=1123057 RepID=U5C7D3_9BACT|nr:hypothetical protein P872_22560 [Rhodonellum psychrophilum GCM71 = DSM 17998]